MPISATSFSNVPTRSTAQTAAPLETRAQSLVNPMSGIANDYLNLFNEIIMLIENYPAMPELRDAILVWRPTTYRDYFRRSNLPGRAAALEAYERCDPTLRQEFEAILMEIAAFANRAAHKARLLGNASDVGAVMSRFCSETSGDMMECLARATHIVNYGVVMKSGKQKPRHHPAN